MTCKICGSKEHLAFPTLCEGCFVMLKGGYIPVIDDWPRFDAPMKEVDWVEDKILADCLLFNLTCASYFFDDAFSEVNALFKKYRDS